MTLLALDQLNLHCTDDVSNKLVQIYFPLGSSKNICTDPWGSLVHLRKSELFFAPHARLFYDSYRIAFLWTFGSYYKSQLL